MTKEVINEITVDGLREIKDMFNQLPADLGGAALRNALRNAAKPMLEEVQRRMRVKTGATRDSIKLQVPRTPDPEEVFIYIQSSRYVARFLEMGTRHMTARPTFGPAFDATANEFIELFKKEAEDQIQKAIKKQAKGGVDYSGLTLGEYAAKRKRTIAKRRQRNKAKGEFVKNKFDELRTQLGNKAFYRLTDKELRKHRQTFLKEARKHYKPKAPI